MRGNLGGMEKSRPARVGRVGACRPAANCAKQAIKLSWFIWALIAFQLRASAQFDTDFQQANKLYEQGNFKEAAAAYQALANRGIESPVVYYNLGNAWYKAGQNGRAMAAYLRAERLAPRDPNVRFNLAFVRSKVNAGKVSTGTALQRALRYFSVNEWTIAAASAFWVFILLLAVTEFRPGWRVLLRNWIVLAGLLTLLVAAALIGALYDLSHAKPAVIIVPEAVVRYGPLEESHTFYTLHDGSEVRLLEDRPDNAWVKVEDGNGRQGWLKREQVLPVFSKQPRV